ncbi:MAG: AAA family ATPase [Methanoregula sp.]|jgi:dephospho-CoA kinase|nr:AAA family ATPase [Methanoregula sp.]
MKVIGVVGLPGSGKGEFAKIAAAHDIPIVVMGDVIRRAVEKAGMAPTDENMGALATKLRLDLGMDAIARLCIPEIQDQRAPIVLVDGIRGDAEVKAFRASFSGFVLVAVAAPFNSRLARLHSRGRSDDTTTESSLRFRDERELGWGLGAALDQADFQINNNRDLFAFTTSVKEILKQIEARA